MMDRLSFLVSFQRFCALDHHKGQFRQCLLVEWTKDSSNLIGPLQKFVHWAFILDAIGQWIMLSKVFI
jgi:hypothetical protein